MPFDRFESGRPDRSGSALQRGTQALRRWLRGQYGAVSLVVVALVLMPALDPGVAQARVGHVARPPAAVWSVKFSYTYGCYEVGTDLVCSVVKACYLSPQSDRALRRLVWGCRRVPTTERTWAEMLKPLPRDGTSASARQGPCRRVSRHGAGRVLLTSDESRRRWTTKSRSQRERLK